MSDELCLIGCHVLLCEDSPDIQRLVTAVLKGAGATVDLAPDGGSAVDQILSSASVGNALDVVLMDIQMPIVDGLEATRRVRASGYHGPIIAFTSLGSQSERTRCLEAGCDEHLRKPAERSELLSTVAHFARHAAVTSC